MKDAFSLPTPNNEQVTEFRALVERERGITLSEDESREAATRLLRFFYLLNIMKSDSTDEES